MWDRWSIFGKSLSKKKFKNRSVSKTYKFYNAKLADFGLAKEYDNDDSIRNHSKAFIKVTVAQIALDFGSRAGFWFQIGKISLGNRTERLF